MSKGIDNYRIFCEVGKSKSFSEAARALYLTQPAVSQAIMQLEEELDTRLFHRSPKGAVLTQEGKLLYEYASSAINLLDTGIAKMDEFKNLTAGELTIGVGDSISRHFLLPFLEEFHYRYPHIQFRIENGTTYELCQLLKSGNVDVAFCNFPIEDERLTLVPCARIHDVFVYGEKYQKIFEETVSFEALANVPLIMLESKSNSRQYVERFVASHGVTLDPVFELGSHDLLLDFARSNFGVACVTREFSTKILEQGILREVSLKHPIPPREIGLAYLESVPLSPASERFVSIVQSRLK